MSKYSNRLKHDIHTLETRCVKKEVMGIMQQGHLKNQPKLIGNLQMEMQFVNIILLEHLDTFGYW